MCYSGHHLMVSGHFYWWVAGSFKPLGTLLRLTAVKRHVCRSTP